MDKTTYPDVTVALLTWNRRRYLEQGLPSLFDNLSSDLRHEILIMDNASEDGTLELVDTYANHLETRIIKNKKNIKFKGYNKLFGMARGRIIIEIDDDVIDFPKNFDKALLNHLDTYQDYGFIALDTVRNQMTDGGGPDYQLCTEDKRGDKTLIECGARGYCAAFRRRDYRIIRPLTFFFPFSLSKPQDYVISGLMRRLLHRRSGVIKGLRCLHANGPLYAAQFQRTELDREKLRDSDCKERILEYNKALSEGKIYSP